jgi:hypothetical protein
MKVLANFSTSYLERFVPERQVGNNEGHPGFQKIMHEGHLQVLGSRVDG